MRMSDAGRVAEACWVAIPGHFPRVELDVFVIMPNHVHGIICIVDDGRGTACRAPTIERFGQPISGSLPTVIRSFKSAVTQRINKLWKTSDTGGACVARTWQRNYYEHIIRDEQSCNQIRQYIADNPAQWGLDQENPSVFGDDNFSVGARHAVPWKGCRGILGTDSVSFQKRGIG